MNLRMTSSPHIRGANSTARIMKDVLIALLPTSAAGIFLFGSRALAVIVVCLLAAIFGESIYGLISKKNTLFDYSAAVTGLLLALTLPANVSYVIAFIGGFFATFVVKGICGGLGQNIFNPALAARAFLLLVWPAEVTRFVEQGTKLTIFAPVDAATAATPLHEMVMLAPPEASLLLMFFGRIGGCIGEVCTAALLLGAAYLLYRKVIHVRIPAAYLGTVAVLTMIFNKGNNPVEWMLYSILGGGLVLGAFFMATDYASSPVTPVGQIIYGVGVGILTVVFRYTGLFPEGVTYAILLMNAGTWLIEQFSAPRRFGMQKGEVKWI